VIDAPLALAFTTGMVVTVNPCGFAMLPAYLSFFVGAEADDDLRSDAATSVARALVVGLAVTLGFVLTFAAVGLVVNLLTDGVYDVAPWVSVVIGVALVAFGVALLSGYEPVVRLPHLDRGGRTRGIGSMALFGVSYAIASLGCSLPLFIGSMSTIFGRGFASGVAYFVAYGLGFGLLITALTVGLAVGERSLVTAVRRALPFVHRVAGGLLVITGAYVAYYGSVEIRSGQGSAIADDSIVNRVSRWSSDVSEWLQDLGATRVGIALAAVVGLAVAYVLAARRRTAGAGVGTAE
jgi:cytochrome c biogenesis protein CcdA